MVCNTQNYWVLGFCPSSDILNNTTFRELDLFPSVIEISSFKRIQQSRCLPLPHLKTETDIVIETLCYLKYWTTIRLQILSNLECLFFTSLLPEPKSPKAVTSIQVYRLCWSMHFSSLPRVLYVRVVFTATISGES
jgi:hypothetical protein